LEDETNLLQAQSSQLIFRQCHQIFAFNGDMAAAWFI
jgi:hypothetical protein